MQSCVCDLCPPDCMPFCFTTASGSRTNPVLLEYSDFETAMQTLTHRGYGKFEYYDGVDLVRASILMDPNPWNHHPNSPSVYTVSDSQPASPWSSPFYDFDNFDDDSQEPSLHDPASPVLYGSPTSDASAFSSVSPTISMGDQYEDLYD